MAVHVLRGWHKISIKTYFFVGVRWTVGSQSATLECHHLSSVSPSDRSKQNKAIWRYKYKICVCWEGCASLSGVQDCLEHRAEYVSCSVFITHNQYSRMWGGASDTQQAPLIVSGTTCHKSLWIVCGRYIRTWSPFSPPSLNTPPSVPHTKFFTSVGGTNCN